MVRPGNPTPSGMELQASGVSCEPDPGHFQRDTKDKPDPNANSKEQPLKELQATVCDSHTSSLTDCLQWFNPRRHSSLQNVSTGLQELTDFFEALQQYLRSEEEGKEEVTLQLLLNVSAQCGVCFPCTSSLATTSIPLVHAVRDDTLLEIQEVWDDIRLLLRRHVLWRLSAHSPLKAEPGHIPTMSVPERLRCLQQLFFLYPQSEVLTHYQRLRSQSVLDLLSALCTSPGCETGFDKLVAGFHCAVPVLTRALTDELHVLSRLVEAHTTVGFLSAAYLRTVAQELTSLMEKECELALRDNTSSYKVKKHSAKSPATVAPAERLTKQRSFSLTSHQLRALTQLAGTLLGFESTVRELLADTTSVDTTGETPGVKGLLRKNSWSSQTSTDANISGEQRALHHSQTQLLEFDWRSAFGGLAPHMAHCVKVVLDDACAKSLQEEEAFRSSGHATIAMSPVPERTTNTAASSSLHQRGDCFGTYLEREVPKKIAKFCGAIATQLDIFLPLAVACSDSSLLEVRSSFVEACGRAAFAMMGRLRERALEVPARAPMKNLPALLSTCIYVHQRLQQYHHRLKDPRNAAKIPLTLLPIQRCQNDIVALQNQLSGYASQVCSTCILEDEENHSWADPKPFFEGERCSFSVQMWFYFLCGLRSDLWAVLPAGLAKELLGQVLSETLQLLVRRYTRARPSYERHLQIRCDITAILLFAEHLMWSVCENPEELFPSCPPSAITTVPGASDWPRRIHSLCEELLTVLIIVTAPLSLLYRTFVTDLMKESRAREHDRPSVHWLPAISPDLFIRDGLVGHTASVCQLRLLTSDPGLNPRLLVRLLLHRDCHLPRTLLESSYLCLENCSEMSAESRKAADAFVVALFNVFSCMASVPQALTLVLQPYLEQAQIWEQLHTLAEPTHSVPVLISCVREVVTRSTTRLLTHLVSMVTIWQAKKEHSGALIRCPVPESIQVKLPSEWNYPPLDAERKEADSNPVIRLTVQTLSLVFSNLPSLVASVPLPLHYLFKEAEKKHAQHSRHLRLVGLPLWVLMGSLIQSLEDLEALEQISGLTLERGAKEPLSLLAECLQFIIGIQQKGVPKPAMHKVLQALEEQRPKWINSQLQKARQLRAHSEFQRGGENGVTVAELTEQKIGLVLLEVCHQAGGSDYLRQIYHIIQGNEELMVLKLQGSSSSSAFPPQSVNFDVGSDSNVDLNRFNPLQQFDHIGKKRLHQSAVVEWAWDWSRLLPAYRGTSQVTFRTLLANR
ncbi:hypothetical protein fugu_003998 [Takifugu bimaculatus]|uniref:KIAA0825 n=1 Tax=Takifugu bimaculatus TaxID=433685 RepID=A0A4Z2BBG5_9TELE|nr:hypothetical protein fugu_003998 [Takifugu bimaculatus]